MKDATLYDDIKEKLIKIIRDRILLDSDSISEDDYSKNLLGTDLKIYPRDLVCLCFFIENEFGIKIPEEAIINEKLIKINDIAEMIYNELKPNVQD